MPARLADRLDVAMDRASVEGLAVVADDEIDPKGSVLFVAR